MGTIYLLSTNYILRFSFSMGGISVRLSFTLISASHSPAIMWYSQIMLVRLSPASPQSWKCVSSFLRTSHFHKPVNWHAIQVDKPRLFKIDLRENPYSIGSVIQIVKQLLFGRSSEIRKVKAISPINRAGKNWVPDWVNIEKNNIIQWKLHLSAWNLGSRLKI